MQRCVALWYPHGHSFASMHRFDSSLDGVDAAPTNSAFVARAMDEYDSDEQPSTPRPAELAPAREDEPSIEEALWRIFTRYADPRRPDRLPSQQFQALARDCQLFGSKADRAAAEVLVRRRLQGRQNHLRFVDFVEILAALSQMLRPHSSDAFRDVLLENVLPLAKRRTVTYVDMTGAVAALLVNMRRPLDGAFEKLDGSLEGFLGFCRVKRLHEATGPGAASPLSVRAAGECYLDATRPGSRNLTRPMFDEALVRLARAAYLSHIAPADQVRALLVQLWRADGAPQPGSPRQRDDLARAVVDMWRADGYRDYLAVAVAPVVHDVPALERLSPARRGPGVR